METMSVAGKQAAVIGGGVIGGSWAALFLAHGIDVVVSDPDKDVEAKVRDVLKDATPTLQAIGSGGDIKFGALSFQPDPKEAVRNADFIQECGPEKPDFKQKLWAELEEVAPRSALLLSSSSGIVASVQSERMRNPERLVIGHPFNPPHLMPLVEVVPSAKTDPKVIDQVVTFYKTLGKVPILIKKEVPGFVANRLQAAILQESVSLVAEQVVTVDQLDEIVIQSLGIRWACCGPFLSFHLGGGPGGLAHFIEHLGPAMEQIWATLKKASFDERTTKVIIDEANGSYGKQSYEDLSSVRDRKEIAVINSLAKC